MPKNRLCIALLSAVSILAIYPTSAQISSDTWGQGGIRVGDSTTTCNASAEGAIRYNDTTNVHQFCNGTAWANINSGATATPAGSSGQVQFNDSGSFGASGNLFWDNTNARLGNATATPGYQLQIQKNDSALTTALYLHNTNASPVNNTGLRIRMAPYDPSFGAPVDIGSIWKNNGDGGGLRNHFWIGANGATDALHFNLNTSYAGIWTSVPTKDLSLGGNTSRTIWLERHTTANTAGNNLTVQAGGATSGATDKNGGNLVLSGGIATGTGRSDILFYGAASGTSGTTDRTPGEVMRVTGVGNVGIGTTNPYTKLEVNGTVKIGDGGETCGANYTGGIRYSGGNMQYCNGTAWTTLGAAGTVALSSITAASANNTIANGAWNQVWNWQLTGAEIGMLVSENAASTGGNNDQALMEVANAVNSTSIPFIVGNQGNALSFIVADDKPDPTPFVIDASGNVGIGTTGPTAKLEVQGTEPQLSVTATGSNKAYIYLNKPDDNSEAGLMFRTGGTNTWTIFSDNATGNPGDLEIVAASLDTDPNPRIRLPVGNKNVLLALSGGNVGIGATSPASKFVVAPPAAETIAAAATITADACGTVKKITASGAVTTNTTNTFTSPTSSYDGCCMDVLNAGANNITLDANAKFKTAGAADQILGQYDMTRVCSDGTNWYQAHAISANQ